MTLVSACCGSRADTPTTPIATTDPVPRWPPRDDTHGGGATRSGPGCVSPGCKVQELERRCDERDLLACNNLGVIYARGRDVEKNRDRARELWDHACTFGFARGCFNLAGLHVDDVDAWLPPMARGCDLGDGLPCERLGEAYSSGQLGRVDLVQSTSYYQRACELRRADSCLELSDAVRNGRGATPDAARADQLFARACELSSKHPACKRRPH